MGVEVATAAGIGFLEAVGLILDTFGIANGIADIIDGDTAIYWGSIVEGEAEYYYIDHNGVMSLQHATYCFGENLPVGTQTFSSTYVWSHVHFLNTGGNATPGSLSYQNPSAVNSYLRFVPSNSYWYKSEIMGADDYRIHGAMISFGQDVPIWHYGDVPDEYPVLGHGVVNGVTSQTMHNNFPNAVYVPVDGGNYSYNDIRVMVVDWVNDNIDESAETITVDDLPSFEEINNTEESTEQESTEPGNGCNCNCDITVDAEGNVYIDGTQVDLSVVAGAGAFGAGAIVNNSPVDIDINAEAGAFGAGAFGAGAFGQVDVNGELNLNGDLDFSGDLVLNGGDINNNQNYSVTAGDINITNNNTYVLESGANIQIEQQESINYDEILSEREFESILNSQDYEIETLETLTLDNDLLPISAPDIPEEPALLAEVRYTPQVLTLCTEIVSELGVMPLYFPLGVFSVICFLMRGHR